MTFLSSAIVKKLQKNEFLDISSWIWRSGIFPVPIKVQQPNVPIDLQMHIKNDYSEYDDDELDNFYSAILWKLHLNGALQRLYKGYTK